MLRRWWYRDDRRDETGSAKVDPQAPRPSEAPTRPLVLSDSASERSAEDRLEDRLEAVGRRGTDQVLSCPFLLRKQTVPFTTRAAPNGAGGRCQPAVQSMHRPSRRVAKRCRPSVLWPIHLHHFLQPRESQHLVSHVLKLARADALYFGAPQFPWLLGLMYIQSISGWVVERFEGLIQEHVILASFLTVK